MDTSKDFKDFAKWQAEIKAIDQGLDEKTLTYVKKLLEGLLHTNQCFLRDAQKYNISHVSHMEGVELLMLLQAAMLFG